MVRSAGEVADAIRVARGRCGVGILVETVDAVRNAAELARLPLSRVYVGLNDLSIERGSRSIFEALTDGLVDEVRPLFTVPFGMAGLTLPDCGRPIPCRLLIGEMARLACDFSFLRRSWRRDVSGATRGRGAAAEGRARVRATARHRGDRPRPGKAGGGGRCDHSGRCRAEGAALRGIEGSRVLVTGAAGFIGANLVRELVRRKARVFALIRPATACPRLAVLEDRIDILDADLEDPLAVDRAVATARPEYTIHAAAPGGHPRTPAERRRMIASIVLGTKTSFTASAGKSLAASYTPEAA